MSGLGAGERGYPDRPSAPITLTLTLSHRGRGDSPALGIPCERRFACSRPLRRAKGTKTVRHHRWVLWSDRPRLGSKGFGWRSRRLGRLIVRRGLRVLRSVGSEFRIAGLRQNRRTRLGSRCRSRLVGMSPLTADPNTSRRLTWWRRQRFLICRGASGYQWDDFASLGLCRALADQRALSLSTAVVSSTNDGQGVLNEVPDFALVLLRASCGLVCCQNLRCAGGTADPLRVWVDR